MQHISWFRSGCCGLSRLNLLLQSSVNQTLSPLFSSVFSGTTLMPLTTFFTVKCLAGVQTMPSEWMNEWMSQKGDGEKGKERLPKRETVVSLARRKNKNKWAFWKKGASTIFSLISGLLYFEQRRKCWIEFCCFSTFLSVSSQVCGQVLILKFVSLLRYKYLCYFLTDAIQLVKLYSSMWLISSDNMNLMLNQMRLLVNI